MSTRIRTIMYTSLCDMNALSCFLLHKTPLYISLIQRRRRDDDKACVNPHIQTYIQTFKSLVIDRRYQRTVLFE